VARASIGYWAPETKQAWLECVRECTRVAIAHGQNFSENDIVKDMLKMYDISRKDRPNSTSSMQRDIMQGRQSEMDDLIGAMVRLAAQKNISIPVISFMYAMLKPQADAVKQSKL